MKIDYNELFLDDMSDECVYHLIHFFQNLALVFEGMHMAKAMRYERDIIRANDPCAGFYDDDENENELAEDDNDPF